VGGDESCGRIICAEAGVGPPIPVTRVAVAVRRGDSSLAVPTEQASTKFPRTCARVEIDLLEQITSSNHKYS
jgi:hypothetical protein